MPPYDEPYWRVEDYEAFASNGVRQVSSTYGFAGIQIPTRPLSR